MVEFNKIYDGYCSPQEFARFQVALCDGVKEKELHTAMGFNISCIYNDISLIADYDLKRGQLVIEIEKSKASHASDITRLLKKRQNEVKDV